jgi:5-methyltetrahydropteroyltriglutamate--homocysteine methyltransferase
MTTPTELIGSIPRPPKLLAALATRDGNDPALDPLDDEEIRETIAAFEATGSPVLTDGAQRKYHNFWTYAVLGMPNTAPGGFPFPISAGHIRRMLRLTAGPFCDVITTSRETAFAKIRARVEGTLMAAEILEGG